MTTQIFTTKDGHSTTFNFSIEMENGLPHKEIIAPNYHAAWRPEDSEYALYVCLSTQELTLSNNISILQTYILEKEIWLVSENCYTIFTNLNDTILEHMNKRELVIYCFDPNKNMIKGLSFKE